MTKQMTKDEFTHQNEFWLDFCHAYAIHKTDGGGFVPLSCWFWGLWGQLRFGCWGFPSGWYRLESFQKACWINNRGLTPLLLYPKK